MTLRVTLEIVPHGSEIGKYCIGGLEIHNTGPCSNWTEGHQYHAQQFSDGGTLLKETADGTLEHNRDHGAWVLVRKAIESLKL